MAKKSKFFRVFTEGHTTDGRVVERQWITDIVETYNTAKYGARIWLEHIRGITPDSAFKAYGDVTAVKAEEVDGKLTLFAQIEPTDELIAMNQKKQKVYTSVEIDPDFAKTGKCYLSGLAVTDSPASLGTEMLAFSATCKDSPLSSRKQRPENLFTSAVEVDFEFEEVSDELGLFAKVKALLSKNKAEAKTDFADVHQAVEEIAQAVAHAETQFGSNVTKGMEDLTKLQTDFNELSTQFNALKTQLEKEEPTGQRRSPATGGDTNMKTDC
ncbi:GPO family capsid scaffolding protein [Shewanella baltica]|uniref:GPO family capsid scaffolding protein n=1 Tax=Shewanella baltica TaxID=62322 RepID=UPI00217E11FA|nr:GPO family capsid scaffolding protein [Shewanella baltica]MCS6160722.1 GPO family capsid scaffolding protein [Shewanella baltica]